MKNYNEEYFYVKETELNYYPTLTYDDEEEECESELFRDIQLDDSEARLLCFDKPIPRNPKLGDYHRITQRSPAISEQLKNILESFNLKGVQFIPAVIIDKKGDEHEGYYIVHVHNLIKCMDKEKSTWTPSDKKPGRAFSIDNLVLDNELIDQIPLGDRLVFAVWENSLNILYHRSVVDKLLEIAPQGLTVYRLSKWDPDLPFIENYMKKLKGEE